MARQPHDPTIPDRTGAYRLDYRPEDALIGGRASLVPPARPKGPSLIGRLVRLPFRIVARLVTLPWRLVTRLLPHRRSAGDA